MGSQPITTRHGYDSPSTFKRNTQHIPIDRIWGTPGIDIKAGGYFQFDEVFVNTDHRCLWMDITFINAFGHSMPPLFRPKARRLHCKDPRLIDIFTYLCHKYANKYQLFSQVRNFEKTYANLPLCQVQYEYECLDEVRCQITEMAESKCRKLRKGNVAYSPILNATRFISESLEPNLKQIKG
jgi:hypothetical protein